MVQAVKGLGDHPPKALTFQMGNEGGVGVLEAEWHDGCVLGESSVPNSQWGSGGRWEELSHVEPLLRTHCTWVTSLRVHSRPVMQVLAHFPGKASKAHAD